MEINNRVETSMSLILHASDAYRLGFEAMRLIREKKFLEAKETIKSARKKSVEGHQVQTEMLTRMMNGETIEADVLLVHAQDHLMNSVLLLDLVDEMILTFERMYIEFHRK